MGTRRSKHNKGRKPDGLHDLLQVNCPICFAPFFVQARRAKRDHKPTCGRCSQGLEPVAKPLRRNPHELEKLANQLLYGRDTDPVVDDRFLGSEGYHAEHAVPKLKVKVLPYVPYTLPKSATAYGRVACCIDCKRPRSGSSGKRCLSCYRIFRLQVHHEAANKYWEEVDQIEPFPEGWEDSPQGRRRVPMFDPRDENEVASRIAAKDWQWEKLNDQRKALDTYRRSTAPTQFNDIYRTQVRAARKAECLESLPHDTEV